MEHWRAHYNTKVQVRELEDLVRKLPKPRTTASERPNRRIPGVARQLDAAQTEALVTAYRAGSTVFDLASQFGIDRRTVGKILGRNGVKTRFVLTPEDIDRAVRLYEKGCSLARVGRQLGVSETTVHRRLRERGVTIRPRYGAAL